MGISLNTVAIVGNLTRDPETRAAGSTTVTQLRVAVNGRRKDNNTGQWVDDPGYYDVTVWGAQGENCQRFLSRGKPVAVSGRLRWREWTDQNTNQKRQAIDIVADVVQFLNDGQPRDNAQGGGGYRSDIDSSPNDFQPAPAPAQTAMPTGPTADDDIPF